MLIQVCVCIQRDSRVRVYFSSGLWVRFVLADFTRASRVVADRERREANAREFIDGFTDAEGLEYFRDAFCRRMRERESGGGGWKARFIETYLSRATGEYRVEKEWWAGKGRRARD